MENLSFLLENMKAESRRSDNMARAVKVLINAYGDSEDSL